MKLSTLRIIAGKWRRRQLQFIPLVGLRPITDATRETVFNWLSPKLAQAVCLDLFAGSGILGLEALSRGAKQLVVVDNNKIALRQLQKNAEQLQATNIHYCNATIPKQFKKIPVQPYNIIFLDPPFGQNLLLPTWQLLTAADYLAADAQLYIKVEKTLQIPTNELLIHWQLLRQVTNGQVTSYLYRYTGIARS